MKAKNDNEINRRSWGTGGESRGLAVWVRDTVSGVVARRGRDHNGAAGMIADMYVHYYHVLGCWHTVLSPNKPAKQEQGLAGQQVSGKSALIFSQSGIMSC
jgi:hypothetical protein